MTNPIDPTPEPTESAAQYRVSAQELSHIVQILQTRKEAEARQRANTVALGDAIEQLGLEMTPDELLSEIHADRARRSGVSRPRRQNAAQRRTFATFAVCAGLAAMMVGSIHMHNLNRAMWMDSSRPLYGPSEFMVETTPAIPTQVEISPAAPAVTVTSQFRAFSQFDEGEAADCDFDSLRALANGKSETETMVQNNGTREDALWTIVKQDGEVKVYVFGTNTEIAKAMNGHEAHLFASTHDGLEEQLVPARLFKNALLVDTPGSSGATLNWGSSITEAASNVHILPGVQIHIGAHEAHIRSADYPPNGAESVSVQFKNQ